MTDQQPHQDSVEAAKKFCYHPTEDMVHWSPEQIENYLVDIIESVRRKAWEEGWSSAVDELMENLRKPRPELKYRDNK